MIRFRNPGTQYSTQVLVIRKLYECLGGKENFTLKDMANVIARAQLMTAYGYAGSTALRLSDKNQESKNSALMNAKMYAEVFRMLGWVAPWGKKSSYPLVFTYIGIHIALSNGDCYRLYEQCVLGINNPTQLTRRMSYVEKIRFFKCALRTIVDLGGIIYKHELCLGPMSVNDENEDEYQAMLSQIRHIRGDQTRLERAFTELAGGLKMKPTAVDNCTRLPIGFMKNCDWVENVNDRSLYGKSMVCIQLTENGAETYQKIVEMYDLRLDEFSGLSKPIQLSLIRLGIYSMLARSGYDLSRVANTIDSDRKNCEHILKGKELLFSPSQTIRRELVEEALGVTLYNGTETNQGVFTFSRSADESLLHSYAQVLLLNSPDQVARELLIEQEDIRFLNSVSKLKSEGFNSSEIVERLFLSYGHANKTVFYPLIATLFRIMGFHCSFSRPGDNGSRWDAIVEDEKRSIPIEIKSPTEELHLSIKAIRQALENKIVLLSRKTYPTTPDVTTLVVGYYLPNERAEVSRLISEFQETYGYKIGVIDFKSLLSMAISILIDEKGFEKEKLFSLTGLINANIQ